jgi:hypothetical protein
MLYTQEEREQRIEIMRRFPEELADLVNDLSDKDLHTHYLKGEWTVAQNVHHVADSHMNAFIRVKLGLTEMNPTIKVYDQDAWADTADVSKVPISTSLGIIDGLHERWCVLWESLDEDDWARPVNHPEEGAITVEHFLRIYFGHGEAHIDQITRTLAAKDA